MAKTQKSGFVRSIGSPVGEADAPNMTDDLLKLAERLERSAIADAEHAINNMVYAERADRKFRIAAALRSRATQQSERIKP